MLCRDEWEKEKEKEEVLPPAKKAKLSKTDDDSGEDGMTLTKDSTASEGTEHAQSDVAMDVNLPDERCENQDRQCGVSFIQHESIQCVWIIRSFKYPCNVMYYMYAIVCMHASYMYLLNQTYMS